MRKINARVFVPIVVFVGLVGCSTPPSPLIDLSPHLVSYSREDLEKNPVRLPPGYNAELFRKLRMNVGFQSISGREKVLRPEGGFEERDMSLSQDLSARLQAEMSQLRRFSIRSDFNRIAAVAEECRKEEDTAKEDVDVSLSCKMMVLKEKQKRYADTVVIYSVEVDYNCEDLRTGDVKFSGAAKGITTRSQFVSYTGTITSGFVDSGSTENQAVVQAALKAIAEIANRLGNEYPVGGRIVGCTSTGTILSMDRGIDEGVGENQECVVYVDDGGVDIPLANATAVPNRKGTSQLTIWRWNTADPDAKKLVREYKRDPKAFVRSYKMYGVGFGMAVPPEWQDGKLCLENLLGAKKESLP